MTTTMLTLCGGTFAHVSPVVRSAHLRFCADHGFAYEHYTERVHEDLPWSWSKLPLIIDEFEQNGVDRVIWCDADCLPLNKGRRLDLTDIDKPLNISLDKNGLCCGFMVIHREALPLVKAWDLLGPLYDHRHGQPSKDTWEQSSFWALNKLFRNVARYVGTIPQSVVANRLTRKLTEMPVFYHDWKGGEAGAWKPDLGHLDFHFSKKQFIFGP